MCVFHRRSGQEAAAAEACREADVPFLSLHSAMVAEPDWLSWIEPDGIHLNSDGHSWIERQVVEWPALLEWAGFESINTATKLVM